MNVLFISNDPALLEDGSAVRARMQSYADAIGTLHIVTRGPRARTLVLGALTIHAVPIRRGRVLTRLPGIIRRIVRAEKIELVSAQDPFEYGWAAMRGVRRTNAKLHVQVHTDFLSPWFVRGVSLRMQLLNRARRMFADRVLPHAAGIRTVSERVKLSLMARYDRHIPEPTVIPIALPGMLPPAVPLPPHPFTFTFVAIGRLEPEKRLSDVLLALARIKYRHPEAGLFVAGEGRERAALEHLAQTLSLTQQVVFLGNRSDAWGLLQSSDVFVQASAYEGYGRTLIEAALGAKPIITTPVGIVGDVLQPKRDALVFPVGDVEALANAMQEVLGDSKRAASLGMAAKESAEKHVQTAENKPSDVAADLQRIRDIVSSIEYKHAK